MATHEVAKPVEGNHYAVSIYVYTFFSGWKKLAGIHRAKDRTLCAHCDFRSDEAHFRAGCREDERRSCCTAVRACASGHVYVNEEAYLKGVVMGLWE